MIQREDKHNFISDGQNVNYSDNEGQNDQINDTQIISIGNEF